MLGFVFLCVICLVLWRMQKRSKEKCLSPPVLRGSLPLIGHSYFLLGDSTYLWTLMKIVSRQSLKAGGVITLKMGPSCYFIITDPEDALTITSNCVNKHFSYDFAKRWLGNSVVIASGSIWKKHRKLLSPAYSLQVLLGFMDIFNAQSRKLRTKLDQLAGSGPFDVSTHLKEMMLENICLTAFGMSSEENADLLLSYAKAVEVILNIIMLRFQTIWLQNDFVYSFSEHKKKEDEALSVVNGMADLIIKRKRAAMLQNNKQPTGTVSGPKGKALLDLLLELANEEAMSDQEIREEIDTAVFAGSDTTSWALTYTLVLLGSHLEVQEKVFRELEEVFGKEDRDVEKLDMSRLVFMEAVIKESLRLYSIVPTTLRTFDKDIKLKNYTLNRGDHCIISSYGMHRHPCWGPDGRDFRPERWLEPETQAFVFAGFSLGRRTCIGKTYAMMTIKTVLSHLLRRYKVTANEKDLKLKLDFILKPISGHFISIERRN